jgi:hypothetical protein
VEQLAPADRLTRQSVLYGVAAYAVVRLARDRRFQVSVIMLAIGVAAAKSALMAAAKDTVEGVVEGVERYYLHIEPRHLHLRRKRRQRRAAVSASVRR